MTTLENDLADRLFATRALTLELVGPLTDEDMVVQAMEDASPTKWHLGHVTWFFEQFILTHELPGYRVFDPAFNYCFNSYYETQGARQPRSLRGLLTRPSIQQVLAYRRHVDGALHELERTGGLARPKVAGLIEVGINHEQQHQELLLTDILSLFAANPLRPSYRPEGVQRPGGGSTTPMGWIGFDAGLRQIGHDGDGYAWDNELPRHTTYIQPFRLADRLVTNGEWLEFMTDGGYDTPAHWLSDGWATVQRDGWQTPLYWVEMDGAWHAMTLNGLQPIDRAAPVAHVSYYEADAYARWAGKRLATEMEWEVAAAGVPIEGNLLSSGVLQTVPAGETTPGKPRQMFGDVWEWTQSAYLPYPGYRPSPGALGEYNGKFMVSQQVLRGASCATPAGHSRRTYRNFFYPRQRWQFVGLRLAEDA
ncbi:MAG: ergothioneine biosynthesis protein EgtB [Hyphomicrobiaceae bacterium]|nr:ergothioneine biosynthesis protein EgtB [Hyphomicrobiaceae bacterium]